MFDYLPLISLDNLYNNFPVLVLICAGFFGLIIGSFLNVLIYRIPQVMFAEWRKDCCEFLEIKNNLNKSEQQSITIFSPLRSMCPYCQYQIPALDNIPVLSYIILQGKCRNCDVNIPSKYPIVEVLTAIISILIIYQFGLTLTSLCVFFLSYLLITAAVIDLEHMIIPDNLTFIGLWSGLLYNLKLINVISFTTIDQAILGAIIGYLFLWVIYWVFKLTTGKEGFGYGDFKLTALFGAWLGVSMLLPIIVLASITAIIFAVINSIFKIRKLDQAFPFGPYLVFAGWVLLMYKDYIPLDNYQIIY